MKKNIFVGALVLSTITPILSFAALEGVKGLIKSAKDIINLTIPVVFGLAIIFFFWGMAKFILHSDDDKTREQGKQQMLWGIIAIFVIVSINGIISYVGDAVGIKTGSTNSGACYGGVDPVDGSPC